MDGYQKKAIEGCPFIGLINLSWRYEYTTHKGMSENSGSNRTNTQGYTGERDSCQPFIYLFIYFCASRMTV